jgi:hypothetical protein
MHQVLDGDRLTLVRPTRHHGRAPPPRITLRRQRVKARPCSVM